MIDRSRVLNQQPSISFGDLVGYSRGGYFSFVARGRHASYFSMKSESHAHFGLAAVD